MDMLEKILNNLPKNKLSRRADLRIKFQLYRLLAFAYLKRLFSFNHELSLLNKGLVAAMVLVVIFGATSIFAYASDSVVPGNIIYPLKKAVEKLEQNIAPSKTAKIAAYEKQSVRRLEEAVNLSEKNSSTTPAAKNVKASIKASVSDDIEKNISEVVDNQQAVRESINKLGDYQKASAAVLQAKEADKAKSEYLDKIAEYAELSDDYQMLEVVNQAQNIINNQKYKYQDEEFKDDEKEEVENNNRSQDNEDTPENKDSQKEDTEADKRGNNRYNREKP
jgi:hypothetical protein